jgi:hypothetical protein
MELRWFVDEARLVRVDSDWRTGKMPSSSPVDLQCAPLPGAPAVGVLPVAHRGI